MLSRARSMAARLVYELRAPYLIGEKQVVVTASVGIASARDAVGGAADLVRNADVAMYMAKANGKSGFAIFDPGMHEAMRERHELSVDLQRAVDLDQLTLLYQPIVDMTRTGSPASRRSCAGRTPAHGTIMPDQFIEIAEETGAILPIGHWVLRQACRQGADWLADGRVPAETFVSVNVSAREIQQLGFVDGVKAVLAESGLEPTHLVLEITETALLKANPATVATLEAVRALGVRTVIDDFGTGYFSLSHLRQFPVDALKIAKEFVQEADDRLAVLGARGRDRRDEPLAGHRRPSPRASRPPSRPSGCASSVAPTGRATPTPDRCSRPISWRRTTPAPSSSRRLRTPRPPRPPLHRARRRGPGSPRSGPRRTGR